MCWYRSTESVRRLHLFAVPEDGKYVFTSAAEQNYSAVEEELQRVVDGLHKTRYYTQGCDKLLVGVDHNHFLVFSRGKAWRALTTCG